MNSKLAPIILFVYNRIDYTIQTLESLKNNHLASDSRLIVYCDGPKSEASTSDLNKINAVRTLIRSQTWPKELIVIENKTNQGLATSILAGVTDVVNEYEKAIILEDDLELSPYFLTYMNHALQQYEKSNNVFSVCGHNFPLDNSNEIPETFFLPITSTIGWGTWKRAWSQLIKDPKIVRTQLLKEKQKAFDLDGAYPYRKLLNLTIEGKASSWGICWYGTIFLRNKLSLFPKHSLVKHIGALGTNIRSTNKHLYDFEPSQSAVKHYTIKEETDVSAFTALKKFLQKSKWKKYSFSNILDFIKLKINKLTN